MAQHDYAIANQGFPAFRSDLNDALAAIVSNNSGATEPTTMFAHQMWVDTAANPSVLKIRNADNDAWITIGSIDQTGDTFTLVNLRTSGPVVFNDAGANVDFRVEGDTDANLLFVDAGNDRVGIGTSSPATKLNLGGSSDQTLQINGSDTAAFVGTSTSVAQISSNRNPTTGAIFDSGRAVSYINLEASNVNGNIQFYTTATNNVNATERMRIDSAGNVGIGTTSPSVASGTGIVINGGGGQARLALKNSNTGDAAGDGFQIGVSDDSSAFIEQRENSHLFFSTNATERMRIDSSGRVTMSAQPRFLAERSGNQTGFNADSLTTVVVYNSAPQNIGSHYNTSNGLFTAPVAGMYVFQGSAYTTSALVTFEQIWLVVNGGRSQYTDVVYTASKLDILVGTWILYMNASDTVGFHPHSSGDTSITIEANVFHTWFKGYLIS